MHAHCTSYNFTGIGEIGNCLLINSSFPCFVKSNVTGIDNTCENNNFPHVILDDIENCILINKRIHTQKQKGNNQNITYGRNIQLKRGKNKLSNFIYRNIFQFTISQQKKDYPLTKKQQQEK